MRSLAMIIGIILIVFGIFTFAYQGISYTKKETVAQIGPVQVNEDQRKTFYIPPLAGGLAFVGGIVLVIVAIRRK